MPLVPQQAHMISPPLRVLRVAEDTDVEAVAAAPLEAVTADRVHDRGCGGASVVGGDEADVGVEAAAGFTVVDPVIEGAQHVGLVDTIRGVGAVVVSRSEYPIAVP